MLRGLLILAGALAFAPAPSSGALWRAERAWSEAEEAGFAAFVESEVDPDFFVRPGLAHDCADILYAFRWIYARERRLPIAATAIDGVLVGHWSARFGPVSKGAWDRDANFLEALRFVFGMTGTRTLPADTYPVAIDREHLRAGVLYREEHHAYVIARVVLDGTEPHPFVTWESTLPPAVRPLRVGVFAPSAPQAASGDGLLRFRWLEETPSGWRYMSLERQPGYSVEQFSTPFLAGRPFAEAVARRLAPEDAPAIVQVLRYSAQVERLARERVPIVLAGHRACARGRAAGSCAEGGPLWELYSTPNRDARMLGYLARIRALVEAREVEPEWVMDLLSAKAIDVGAPIGGEGEGEDARRLDLEDLYQGARFVSSEPGDEIAKRWGRAVCESLADRAAALEASLAFLRERSGQPGDDYTSRAVESRELELADVEGERRIARCTN